MKIPRAEYSKNPKGLKMKLITLNIPESYLKDLDLLVNEKYYPNRSEAIRVAIRDLIREEVWERKE